ncbi:MAG: hypothetical protein AAGI15_01880 [Pseudomonadota bacterium]
MKTALTVLVVLIALAYGGLAMVGVEPQDRRPGTKLGGTDAALPADLATLAEPQEVHLQTHPWYGIPFSVTTVIAEQDGLLVIPSLYEAQMPFPGTKYWNKVVAADPSVRLRVDGKLYDMNIYPIEDAATFEQGFAALATKYPYWAGKVEEAQTAPRFALLRLEPR